MIAETHILQIVIASSYITLGIASPHLAREWWWVYATITLVLSSINIFQEWREGRKCNLKKN